MKLPTNYSPKWNWDRSDSLFHVSQFRSKSLQVYYVSRGRLKPANKKFSSVRNDYELNMNEDTEVELVGVAITSLLHHRLSVFHSMQCTEEAPDLPSLQYNFTSIAEIETTEPNTLIGWFHLESHSTVYVVCASCVCA